MLPLTFREPRSPRLRVGLPKPAQADAKARRMGRPPFAEPEQKVTLSTNSSNR